MREYNKPPPKSFVSGAIFLLIGMLFIIFLVIVIPFLSAPGNLGCDHGPTVANCGVLSQVVR